MNNAFWNNPIVHGILTVVLMVIPTVIAAGGSWQSLTIGGLLVAAYQALKNFLNPVPTTMMGAPKR